MILQLPAVTPVTIPDEEPTVAIAVLELDHEPPVTVLLKMVVLPVPTVVMPVMAGIDGPTLIIW